MSKKLVGALGAVVVLFGAVYVIFFRHRGGEAAPEKPTSQARSAKVDVKPAGAKQDDTPAPRGFAPKWSLDVDPEGPLRMEGQVVGPDGAPIGGAEVELASVPPRTTKTEADGGFAFDKLVGRTYHLGATAGKQIGTVTYKLTASSDPIVIHVSQGAAVVVHVIDEQKQPIANASVKSAGEDNHDVKTDDKGEARVEPIQPGWAAVEASASGYATNSAFTSVGSSAAAAQLTITLHKGVPVSGRVVDEHGKPLAKVHVSAGDGSGWGWGQTDTQETDAKGEFHFAALAAGTHVVHASDGEHEPGQSEPFTVNASRATTGIEIKLRAGGAMAGIVVDKEGNPAKFATVRIAGTGARMWMVASRQTTTDDHGKFELRGLTRAKLQARAESDAAASKLVDVDLVAQQAVRDVKLVLDVTGTISGVVVDDQQQPVPEVSVNAFPDLLGGATGESLAIAGMSSATTDGAGHFTIRGLPDGAYRLWAARSASQEGGWGQQGTPAKTGDASVKITLPAPGGIKGTIALESGAAPKHAAIQIGAHPATPTDDGTFELKDLAPGMYDLTVRGPEFALTTVHDIKIDPGKTTDAGTIKVMRGRKLTGRVVDSGGAPVGGAKVRLGEMLFSVSGTDEERAANWEEMSGIRTAVTDQDGAFAIVGVSKKASTVMADHPDRGRSVPTPVVEGNDDPPAMTLALRGFGSITGKVTSKGEPLADVTVSDSTKGGGMSATFAKTGSDGTFTIAKVAEGTHVLSAMQQQMMAMKSTSVTVEVVAGKATPVTIDIPVGSIKLTADMRPQGGAKVDAAQVFLFHGIIAPPQNGKQLADGFFQGSIAGMKFWFGVGKPAPEFDELVAGDYTLCAVPITGDLSDPQFQQRLQENMQTLRVACKQVKVAPAPTAQTVVDEIPAMTPLPTPSH